MDLFLSTEFDVDPLRVLEVYESQPYRQQVADASGMDKELLERRDEGDVRHERIRVQRREPLPGFVAKILGSKTLTYFQIDRTELSTGNSTWRVEIPALGERVSIRGSTTFTPTPRGCVRVVRGSVSVKVPLVGGRIEKAVAGDFQRGAARAAEIAKGLLASESP